MPSVHAAGCPRLTGAMRGHCGTIPPRQTRNPGNERPGKDPGFTESRRRLRGNGIIPEPSGSINKVMADSFSIDQIIRAGALIEPSLTADRSRWGGDDPPRRGSSIGSPSCRYASGSFLPFRVGIIELGEAGLPLAPRAFPGRGISGAAGRVPSAAQVRSGAAEGVKFRKGRPPSASSPMGRSARKGRRRAVHGDRPLRAAR